MLNFLFKVSVRSVLFGFGFSFSFLAFSMFGESGR